MHGNEECGYWYSLVQFSWFVHNFIVGALKLIPAPRNPVYCRAEPCLLFCAPSFCAPSSHLLELCQTTLHCYSQGFHGQHFGKWVASSFFLILKLRWNLSTMDDPAGIWNTSGIAFSITEHDNWQYYCHHGVTTDRRVEWFSDQEMNPGCRGENIKS